MGYVDYVPCYHQVKLISSCLQKALLIAATVSVASHLLTPYINHLKYSRECEALWLGARSPNVCKSIQHHIDYLLHTIRNIPAVSAADV